MTRPFGGRPAGSMWSLSCAAPLAGAELPDGHQGQAKVADFGEQPVQCGLIWERAGDARLPRGGCRDDQAVEPVRPLRVEDSLDADLVVDRPSRLVHLAPPLHVLPAKVWTGRHPSITRRWSMGVESCDPAAVRFAQRLRR
jgi:hypothetical protein